MSKKIIKIFLKKVKTRRNHEKSNVHHYIREVNNIEWRVKELGSYTALCSKPGNTPWDYCSITPQVDMRVNCHVEVFHGADDGPLWPPRVTTNHFLSLQLIKNLNPHGHFPFTPKAQWPNFGDNTTFTSMAESISSTYS